MKLIQHSKPFTDLLRLAIDSDVIDGWGRHGPYLVFTNGTARFYVRRHEAEDFVDRLLGKTSPCGQVAA